jgi:hypothetical protein
MMKQDTHFIQDACEYYAVAKMQEYAEKFGLAIDPVSGARRKEYEEYLKKRGLSHKLIESGDYVRNIDRAVPIFMDELFAKHPEEKVNFTNIEKEARDKNLKGDFQIDFSNRKSIDFSLKNYKGGIRRIQLKSGTFNSFVLNFLFKPCGVGSLYYIDSKGNEVKFRGSDKKKRDDAITAIGYAKLIPLVHKMDSIHEGMRAAIFKSGEYDFYDENKFDALRKSVGIAGVSTGLAIMKMIDLSVVRTQIIDMTGFDGTEELLAVSPMEHLDSYTNKRFHKFRQDLLNDDCKIVFDVRGQSLIFTFELDDNKILNVEIPFTINSNGAWYRDEPFEGEIYHPKEKMKLKYGQLRPKKSREIATSINTYVDLGSTSIYSEDEI